MRPFCRKNHVHKIPRFRGGGYFGFGGGGSADFIFMGARIFLIIYSGVNKSARERIGRQNLFQKVPSKKGSLGVIFSPRNYRENAHSKSANFEVRHSGGRLLSRPLLFTSDIFWHSLPEFGA